MKTMRWRTCNCVEIGIDPNSIIVWFWKLKYPNANFVKECTHWEKTTVETYVPKEGL